MTHLEVEVARTANSLTLNYKLAGAIRDLALPACEPPSRTDGLWQRTCFEMFLRTAPGDGYFEFNLSPSTRWAAYRFSEYRAKRVDAPEAFRPHIRFMAAWKGLALVAKFEKLPEGDWELGLSAVIEEADGTKSYWALAHPPGPPDFHHPDCFALELPAAPAP